jgi:hypothetical protein
MNAPSTHSFAGGAGLSGHLDPLLCARQACEQAAEALDGHSADLVLIFRER